MYNSIKKYSDSNPTAFHMPGHKLGKGIPEELLQNLARLDVTEIPGTDNLHSAEGVIKEAQDLAAEAFKADRTFFLVNGSTCGIHAVIMTICKPGGKLIVARDCHKSVINGMILGGVEPVYIKPEYNDSFCISTAVSPREVEKALTSNPDAAGVLVTRPSYYGICADIEEIARITHRYGKVLAVDEAHGAHLVFSRRLPVSALEAGADICVQSAHKTLAAFTQGAYLHVKSQAVDLERLAFNLALLQTSSPSYIIMAFLDVARAIMEEDGTQLLDGLLDRIGELKSKLDGLDGVYTLINSPANDRADATRIVINVRRLGLPAFGVERILRKDYNIQVEMSDLFNIVCIATISDSEESFERLYCALAELAHRFKGAEPLKAMASNELAIPEQLLTLKEASLRKTKKVPLGEAVGKISGAMVTPYPPGIPVICPGEIIMEDVVDYVYNIINNSGIVNGIGHNNDINVLE